MKWRCIAIVLGVLGCSSPDTPVAIGVQFRIDSPLCGATRYPFTFSIDSVVVGTDTLKDKDISPLFATPPGPHRLQAALTGPHFANILVDTTVTVVPDSAFVQVVGVYCS